MKGFRGQELRFNDDFRSITPNEFISEGTLVWSERFTDAYYNVAVEGPYVIEEGWGPIWFGSPNQNKPDADFVKLISTITGAVWEVSYGTFLNTTFYVMNEEKLCIDADPK